jgi:hypothetical protein
LIKDKKKKKGKKDKKDKKEKREKRKDKDKDRNINTKTAYKRNLSIVSSTLLNRPKKKRMS